MTPEPTVAVIGGGVAGLAAALALGTAGHQVTVYESRAFPGGRATSYPLQPRDGDTEPVVIDNCQHILLRCCQNLMDFYRRLGVEDKIHFFNEFYWMQPGGKLSVMKRGVLPAPAHFTGSFAKLNFLTISDKWALIRGLLAVRSEYGIRKDLDSITMLDWLHEKQQTPRAIERFWRQILVSAVNEELDVMAASHGLQVLYLGFLASGDAYEMGVPSVPLADLYTQKAWNEHPNINFKFRSTIERLDIRGDRVHGAVVRGSDEIEADFYVLAVPFERVGAIAPELHLDLSEFTHVPITGIHLWFDRPITELPHATFLDRTIHWLYNKDSGKHVQIVVSASRSLLKMSREEVIALTLRELAEFMPAVTDAKLLRAHVVKEARATISAKVGLESKRPVSKTRIENLFLAGDWTKSGWPSTMEGSVRSGYLAAEAVLESIGKPRRFLLADPR